MAEIKPQVYKDPRPAEYFTRFPSALAPANPIVSMTWRGSCSRPPPCSSTAPGHRDRERPQVRPRDPRPESLLELGPLLRGRLPAAQGPVHGQVAAVRRQPRDHLHHLPRRGVPGAPRPPGPGGVHHRPCDPRQRRLHADLRRGRALAHRRARSAATRGRLPGARVGGSRGAGGDPRLQGRPGVEEAPVPEGDDPVRRAADLRGRRAPLARAGTGGRRARSSSRCGRCTRRSRRRVAGA